MGLFDKKTTTNTTSTTNATQTNVAVGDGGFLLGDNSNLSFTSDESTTLIDSRDLSQVLNDSRDQSVSNTLNDSRNQSLTYTDNSITYDPSEQIARDALAFADHQNALNAGLWGAAMSETYSAGLNYSKLSGEAYAGANASIIDMATFFANKTGDITDRALTSVENANQSDGLALAGSLEKFGKMGVFLILGVAVIASIKR